MSWLFDTSSPLDDVMEKATAEHQTTENWELILHICDAIKSDTKYVKPAVISIKKRLNHRDPHVVILALSVLDSCWANSGVTFRREISSREFINELESKCKSSVRQVGEKTRLMIKKWVDAEVKEDESLSLVRTLYKNLAADGHSFESSEPKKRAIISNDPNVVTSQEEEDAIAKAIAASLSDAPKENGGSGNKSASSLYPSAMNGGSRNESSIHPSAPAASPSPPALASILKDPTTVTMGKDRAYPSLSMASTICPKTIRFASPKKKNDSLGGAPPPSLWPILQSESNETVKAAVYGAPRLEKRAFALYDFEAAEDNELSFKTGDEMTITDDSNANWWRGRNERTRREGLFPSSFVTDNPAEITAQKTETTIVQSTPVAAVVRIDEEQLLKCIALLEDCDPTGAMPDPPELGQIEASSLAQAPLIDAALASVDRQSNALAMVDVAIRNVLALYDGAVQQAAYSVPRYAPPPGQPMQPMQQMQQGGGHPQQMQQQYYAPPPQQQQPMQQHPQMQHPQMQHPHYAQQPGQQAAPADWQQQQYMQQMQQQQQQQAHQYAAPPAPYPQYAPVPAGHPEQQY